jgi:hypothetical protein
MPKKENALVKMTSAKGITALVTVIPTTEGSASSVKVGPGNGSLRCRDDNLRLLCTSLGCLLHANRVLDRLEVAGQQVAHVVLGGAGLREDDQAHLAATGNV